MSLARIPHPDEPIPRVAWPTVALFVSAVAAWAGATALAVSGVWPWPLSTVINTLAGFALFTVAHECSHSAASTSRAVNTWLGRVSMLGFAPHAGFRALRFIHMQHHRFTNYDDGRDPDAYTHHGPAWQLPARWLTVDVHYLLWYRRHLRNRPRPEQRELLVSLAVAAAANAALAATGNWLVLFALWLIPARLAIALLGWAFDYLPHHGLEHTQPDDRFKVTRNRIGAERLLTPLLLYQNYHLVHHLHPVIPFYRYILVWRRHEDQYLDAQPALSDARGRPLTMDEYRALRRMQECA